MMVLTGSGDEPLIIVLEDGNEEEITTIELEGSKVKGGRCIGCGN